MNSATAPVSTHQVDEHLSVTGQLEPHQMARIAAAGFRSVINNRPDLEAGAGQPASAAIEAAAAEAGLAYRYLPVPPSGHDEHQARAMAAAVASLPSPVLAFCRTGRRSAALYHLGQVVGQGHPRTDAGG